MEPGRASSLFFIISAIDGWIPHDIERSPSRSDAWAIVHAHTIALRTRQHTRTLASWALLPPALTHLPVAAHTFSLDLSLYIYPFLSLSQIFLSVVYLFLLLETETLTLSLDKKKQDKEVTRIIWGDQKATQISDGRPVVNVRWGHRRAATNAPNADDRDSLPRGPVHVPFTSFYLSTS
jgi:hypothetical protein